MSHECNRCSRKTDMFICTTCVQGLRQQLLDLPWWLDRLVETAVGQAKLSDGGRRSKRRNVLHGDDSLASHIEKFPNENETDLEKARRQRERAALAHALSIGRVNARASDEYDRIHGTLTRWIQDLCESRGIETPILKTASGMAKWLAKHVSAIAGQEDAEQCCDDIADITKKVERIVNRPIPPRYVGPCPGEAPEQVLTKRREEDNHETRCNRELTASHKSDAVTCPQCDTTHEIEAVIAQNLEESGDKLMTIRELVDWVLPRLDEPVPERTLYRWMRNGTLEVVGRNDRGDDMVRLSDVLVIRRSKPRHAAS